MRRSNTINAMFTFALFGAVVFTMACDGTPASLEARGESPATLDARQSASMGDVNQGLATLRRATARYHRIDAAIADGFERIPALGCVDPPRPGAVGIPLLNFDRLDATIDLAKPEVLFYEPRKNGKLRLVGAEPVVPIELWDATADDPPSLFGNEFHRNEDDGLYGLHMWVWQHNPDGMFAFTNPNVSCEFAE